LRIGWFQTTVGTRSSEPYGILVFTRDSIMLQRVYATAIPTARPSVTRVLYKAHACFTKQACLTQVLKRLNASRKFFYHLIGPSLLVFHHQGLLRKSDGITPNGGAEYKGGSDFRPIAYAAISRNR